MSKTFEEAVSDNLSSAIKEINSESLGNIMRVIEGVIEKKERGEVDVNKICVRYLNDQGGLEFGEFLVTLMHELIIGNFSKNLDILPFLRKILENNLINNINETDALGRTALKLAISGKQYEVVKLLLEGGADLDIQDKDRKSTALHSAAYMGQYEIVRMLLDKGANSNIQDKNGQTALNLASCVRQYEIVRLLLDKGADLNMQDEKGCTLLHFFAYIGQSEMVRLLLDKGANPNIQDKNGKTALSSAMHMGQYEAVKLLLEGGADLKIQDKNGKTALSIAMSLRMDKEENLEVINLLLTKAADIIDDREMQDIYFFISGSNTSILEDAEVSKLLCLSTQRLSCAINFLEVTKKLLNKGKGVIKKDVKEFCNNLLKSLQTLKGLVPNLLDGELVEELEGLISEISENYLKGREQPVTQVNFLTSISYNNPEFIRVAQEKAKKKIEEKNTNNEKNEEPGFIERVLEKLKGDTFIDEIGVWITNEIHIAYDTSRGMFFGKKPDDNGDPGGFGGGAGIAQIASEKEGDEDFSFIFLSGNSTHSYE